MRREALVLIPLLALPACSSTRSGQQPADQPTRPKAPRVTIRKSVLPIPVEHYLVHVDWLRLRRSSTFRRHAVPLQKPGFGTDDMFRRSARERACLPAGSAGRQGVATAPSADSAGPQACHGSRYQEE